MFWVNNMTRIDWETPEQSKGLGRVVDELIGPGATRAEIVLVFVVGIIGGCAVIAYQYVVGLGWDLLQLIVGAIIAFDIAGGVIANATSTAKRWYHREGQGFKQHFGFVVVHFIHLSIICAY